MKVAYVIHRYGSGIYGGAEAVCRIFAERLARRGISVEVFTSCARDYMTWADEYPAGTTVESGVVVHRFPVTTERSEDFPELTWDLFLDPASASRALQEDWICKQGPQSPGILQALEREGARFDAIVFFTYLYYPTFFGLRIAHHKAILHPTAHDEHPIYLPVFDEMFRFPKAFVYATEEEREFVDHRFDVGRVPGLVAGLGVDPPDDVDPDRGRRAVGIEEPFVLYVGRLDESKGCRHLGEWFRAYRERRSEPLKLLLAGAEASYVPPEHRDIVHVGAVDDRTKWDLMAAAEVLVHPSSFESFGVVLLEAWSVGTPALVNGYSEVFEGHCRRGGGGIWYRSYVEFEAALNLLLGDSERRRRLGEQGREYALREYTWEAIMDRYVTFLRNRVDVLAGSRTPRACPSSG